MKNELKIGNVCYKLNNNQQDFRKSLLYVDKDDENYILSVSLDCYFDENLDSPEEASISPSVSINTIDISSKKTKNLNGFEFEVKTADESYEREDSLYYYEHEPFEKYNFIINNYTDEVADVSIIGTAIIDGYSKPYKTKEIEMYCTLPVKISIQKKELLNFSSKGTNGKQLFSSKYKFVLYKDELKMYNNKGLVREIYYKDIKEIISNRSSMSIMCNTKNITIINVPNDLFNKIKDIINK